MPVFNPQPWNTPAAIGTNNCYNYALDRLDGVRRDPGRLAGQALLPFQNSTALYVAAGAAHDGLTAIAMPFPTTMQTNDLWLAALVIAPPHQGRPTGDYHWLRRDNDGTWSHKTGFGAPATNVDDSGNRIHDPFACDRSDYIYFIGFFAVQRRLIKP